MKNGTISLINLRRWAALYSYLQELEGYLKDQAQGAVHDNDDALTYRLRTLAMMTNNLKRFAECHVNFLRLGKTDDITPGYSTEYAISLVLQQMGFDIQVIQQAAFQRLRAMTYAERETLDVADKLARRALLPAQKAGLVDMDATVITYFQKSPYIRVVPYAKCGLIGIPYTTTWAKRDYLAIPHEVGHYVYWNGKIKTDGGAIVWRKLIETFPIPAKGDKRPSQLLARQWLEEVFSDIYGCVITPESVLSLQDLLLRSSADTLAVSGTNDDHPTPILRPYICSQALGRRGPTTKAIAEVFNQRWDTQLGSVREGLKKFKEELKDNSAWQAIRDGNAILPYLGKKLINEVVSQNPPDEADQNNKPLDRVINTAFEIVQLRAFERDTEIWAKDDEALAKRLSAKDANLEAEAIEQLDENFRQRVADVTDIQRPELREEPDPWHVWLQAQRLSESGPRDWLDIANGVGWTQGPNDQWPKVG